MRGCSALEPSPHGGSGASWAVRPGSSGPWTRRAPTSRPARSTWRGTRRPSSSSSQAKRTTSAL
eukprot:2389400-Lingulodinium_polyedra.AAC.1